MLGSRLGLEPAAPQSADLTVSLAALDGGAGLEDVRVGGGVCGCVWVCVGRWVGGWVGGWVWVWVWVSGCLSL